MNSHVIDRIYERFEDLEHALREPLTYFRLQGRLGNQLFGLSDAHLAYKISGKRTVVDISQIIEEAGYPEWIEYTDKWNWLILLTKPTGDYESIRSREFNFASLKNLSEIKQYKYFCGFKPSLEHLEKSGLFVKGTFPFSELHQSPSSNTAICVRRGDYHENPHLGVLTLRYYKKALRRLAVKPNEDKIVIFTDDIPGTDQFLSTFLKAPVVFNREESPLQALRDLSSCSTIICANSTFSFLGCFFSNARTLIPEPFYLSEPRWHKELISVDQKTITHTRIPKMLYRWSIASRKIRGFLNKNPNF